MVCGGVCNGYSETTQKHAEILEDNFNVSPDMAGHNEVLVLGKWHFELTGYELLPADDPMFPRYIRAQSDEKEVVVILYRYRQNKVFWADADLGMYFRDAAFQSHHAESEATRAYVKSQKGTYENPWYLPTAQRSEWVNVAEAYLLPKGQSKDASFAITSKETYQQDVILWTRTRTKRYIAVFDLGTPTTHVVRQAARR